LTDVSLNRVKMVVSTSWMGNAENRGSGQFCKISRQFVMNGS
jgi:hypothetical protein